MHEENRYRPRHKLCGSDLLSNDFNDYCWELMDQSEPVVHLNLSELDSVNEVHVAILHAMSLRLSKHNRTMQITGRKGIIASLKEAGFSGNIVWCIENGEGA